MKFEERNDSAKIIWDKNIFFLVLGGLCFALDMSIWNWSLTFTSVANATLMANIAPVFVVIFGVLFLGYKIEIFFIVTLLLALMGVFLVILPGEQIMVFGDSLGILAAVFYAGYILSIKDLTNILQPARTLFLVTIITTVCLLPISLIETDSLILSKSEFFILISYAIFLKLLLKLNYLRNFKSFRPFIFISTFNATCGGCILWMVFSTRVIEPVTNGRGINSFGSYLFSFKGMS